MIRRIRNIAFVIMLVTFSLAVTHGVQATGCSPWNCNTFGCIGTCSTCYDGAIACQENCGGYGGISENFQCQEFYDPPSASVSCSCYYPE